MSRNRVETAIVAGALTGFLVAITVFCFGYWESGHQQYVSATLDSFAQVAILCLCPPRLALMAGDNLRGLQLAPLLIVISLLNAAWHVLLALIVSKLLRVLPADRE